MILDLNAIDCVDVASKLKVGDTIKYSHVFSEDVYSIGTVTAIHGSGASIKIVKPDSDTHWIVPIYVSVDGEAKHCLATLEVIEG